MKQILALGIGIVLLISCKMKEKGRFFTKQRYENELHQEVNIDVLERINNDSSLTADKMVFSFYFITDERKKIDSLVDYLKANEKNQQIIEPNKINEIWELNGRSYPIKLEIDCINNWERKMWDIGYRFDCILDGWETTYANVN